MHSNEKYQNETCFKLRPKVGQSSRISRVLFKSLKNDSLNEKTLTTSALEWKQKSPSEIYPELQFQQVIRLTKIRKNHLQI